MLTKALHKNEKWSYLENFEPILKIFGAPDLAIMDSSWIHDK